MSWIYLQGNVIWTLRRDSFIVSVALCECIWLLLKKHYLIFSQKKHYLIISRLVNKMVVNTERTVATWYLQKSCTHHIILQLGFPKSNSNKLIFHFPLSHHIGKSTFSISTYMEEVLQQIDFFPFLYGKGDVMSPLSIGG